MMSISYQAAMREPLLDLKQERDAICSWQDKRDTAALELLVRSHARQAWSHAAKFTDNPVHLEDLASEGMIGLMRAADNFDLKQDVRFSTYAGWWVMNGISSALSRIKAVIDIPSRTYLDAQLGKLTEDERQLVIQAVQGVVVIDGSFADDDAGRQDVLVSEELGPEDIISERDRHEMLSRLLVDALKPLSHEETEVIRRRKLAQEPEPFCAIARDLGVSEGRLRQVERRAMMRLRRNLVDRGFSRNVLS